jgi:hypothetical protein
MCIDSSMPMAKMSRDPEQHLPTARRLRRLLIVGIALVPALVCAALCVRGRNTVDHICFTHAADPQWIFQLTLSGPRPLLILVLPTYDASPWRRDLPRVQHIVENSRWSTADFRPQPPVFDLLGLREFEYGYVDETEKDDCAAFVVPAWLVWLSCAVPVAYALRTRVDGPWRLIAGRALRSCALKACLVPIALAGFIWWRSYRAWDMIQYATHQSQTQLYVAAGWVVVTRSPLSYDVVRISRLHNLGRYSMESAASWVERAPFRNAPVRTVGRVYADTTTQYAQARTRAFAAPLWAVTLLSLLPILPMFAMTVRRRRAKARRSAGLCVNCGYDLRATPGRCPECGAVPAESRREDSLSKSAADEAVDGV